MVRDTATPANRPYEAAADSTRRVSTSDRPACGGPRSRSGGEPPSRGGGGRDADTDIHGLEHPRGPG